MSASRNEARGLSGNQYFTWHALPRSQHRFLLPPDFRRLTGGGTGAEPPDNRPAADHPTGGVAAAQPPAHPLPLPSHDRAVAGQLPGPLRAPAHQSPRSRLMTRRRPAVGVTGAKTGSPPGNSPNIVPAYARP